MTREHRTLERAAATLFNAHNALTIAHRYAPVADRASTITAVQVDIFEALDAIAAIIGKEKMLAADWVDCGEEAAPPAGRQDMQAMTSPNSFQRCAKDYANAFGFIVVACGNWVELTSTKTGKTQKCYTMQGVQDLCQSAGPNV